MWQVREQVCRHRNVVLFQIGGNQYYQIVTFTSTVSEGASPLKREFKCCFSIWKYLRKKIGDFEVFKDFANTVHF